MPFLPPSPASTAHSNVEGIIAKSIPRLYVHATNPAMSVVLPPPIAISISFFLNSSDASVDIILRYVSVFFLPSLRGMSALGLKVSE